MARVNARTSVFWVATLLLGLLVGSTLVGSASADPAGPPGGLEVSEQNLDQDGNIKVHEQGVVPVDVQDESFDVNVDFPLNQVVTVDNTPLPVEGTVNVGNLPLTQDVSAAQDGVWNVGITGTPDVNVVNELEVTFAPAPATRSLTRTSYIAPGGDPDEITVDPVLNASTIIVDSPYEITVSIDSPLTVLGGDIFLGDPDADFGRMAISLIQPFPVSFFEVTCHELDCWYTVTLIGK